MCLEPSSALHVYYAFVICSGPVRWLRWDWNPGHSDSTVRDSEILQANVLQRSGEM